MPSYIIYIMLIIACAVYVTRAVHPAPGTSVHRYSTCPYSTVYPTPQQLTVDISVFGLTGMVSMSKCVPEHMSDTIGLVSVVMGVHGQCKNLVEIKGFKQCRGYCHSVDARSKQTGKYEQKCQCCRVKSFTHVPAELTCEYGETIQYNASTPDQCSCRPCGDTWTPEDENTLDPESKIF